MSQDAVADALNMIMNVKRAGKFKLEVKRYSKLLINVLEIIKKDKLIDYKIDEKEKKIDIEIKELNECVAIKPRFYVQAKEIEKYARRFLPAKNIGKIIISTSKGLKTHDEAFKENIGGSLIAYFY